MQRSFRANVTQCAENNLPFCTENDNYPIEHVRKLMQEHFDRYADMFLSDVVDFSMRVDSDIEYLCESYEKVIFPTSGKTKDGDERFILNTDEHKQGVRVALCRKSGETCRMSGAFPVGYKTECKQQMVYRELVGLAADGSPIKDKFEFPACCTCVLHNLNFV